MIASGAHATLTGVALGVLATAHPPSRGDWSGPRQPHHMIEIEEDASEVAALEEEGDHPPRPGNSR